MEVSLILMNRLKFKLRTVLRAQREARALLIQVARQESVMQGYSSCWRAVYKAALDVGIHAAGVAAGGYRANTARVQA